MTGKITNHKTKEFCKTSPHGLRLFTSVPCLGRVVLIKLGIKTLPNHFLLLLNVYVFVRYPLSTRLRDSTLIFSLTYPLQVLRALYPFLP